MKKLLGIFLAFALLFVLVKGAWAEPLSNTWYLNNTAMNGVSYYFINLKEAPGLTGLFSASIGKNVHAGVTAAGVKAGVTSTLEYAETNEIPTATQLAGTAPFPVLNWKTIWSGKDIFTGTTPYPVAWYPTVASGIVLRHTSGVTRMNFQVITEGR